MVVTVSKPAKAEYYIRSQAYFQAPSMTFPARGEPDGSWWNPSTLFEHDKHPLLQGQSVDSAHFYRLYDGFHPHDRTRLTLNSGKPRRAPGHDLTFTADKSISALWAIAPVQLQTAIAELHDRAVKTALDEIVAKHCAFTRSRKSPTTTVIHRAHILGALFQHGNSRAGDPHLHTRAVLFNLSLAHHDGKWRSLHGRALYLWQKAAGAVYRTQLAWLLRHELGIPTEQHGAGGQFTRIPGIPQPLLHRWSSRTGQLKRINNQMQPEPLNPASKNSVRRKSGLNTTRVLPGRERHVLWTLEALEQIDDISALVDTLTSHPKSVPQHELIQTRKAIASLPSTLTSLDKPLTHPTVATAAANAAAGRLSPQERASALQSVLSHRGLQSVLVSPPYTDGMEIHSPSADAT